MRINAYDRQWGKRQDRTWGTPGHAADLTQSQPRQWKAAEQRLTISAFGRNGLVPAPHTFAASVWGLFKKSIYLGPKAAGS